MQTTLYAGETLNYRAEVSGYPASDGWALTLVLALRSGGTPITVNSTPDAAGHLVQASAVTTAAWAPGAYGWELWALRGAERYRVEQGQLVVAPSLLGAVAGVDTRSQAEQARDALRAAWLAYAQSGNFVVQEMWVAGRKVMYRTVAELRAALNAAERDVLAEQRARVIAAGGSGRERLVTRM